LEKAWRRLSDRLNSSSHSSPTSIRPSPHTGAGSPVLEELLVSDTPIVVSPVVSGPMVVDGSVVGPAVVLGSVVGPAVVLGSVVGPAVVLGSEVPVPVADTVPALVVGVGSVAEMVAGAVVSAVVPAVSEALPVPVAVTVVSPVSPQAAREAAQRVVIKVLRMPPGVSRRGREIE
jgi:hypothetical protein